MDLSNKLFTSPFLKMYKFNMEMLNYRMNKVLSMDVTGPLDKEKQAEYLMAFDSMLILFRSLFLEKKKGNYTCQNFYREIGHPEIAQEIDNLLDEPFEDGVSAKGSPLTIRYVLKFICDKFVCHQNSISFDEYGLCNAWMIKLKNPYFDKNLNYITNRLNNILKTPIKWDSLE